MKFYLSSSSRNLETIREFLQALCFLHIRDPGKNLYHRKNWISDMKKIHRSPLFPAEVYGYFLNSGMTLYCLVGMK